MNQNDRLARLNVLSHEEDKVRTELAAIHAEQNSLQTKIAEENFGFTIGGTVRHKDKLWIVDSVRWIGEFSPDDKPWLCGFQIKKDNSVSIRRQLLFADWEPV